MDRMVFFGVVGVRKILVFFRIIFMCIRIYIRILVFSVYVFRLVLVVVFLV